MHSSAQTHQLLFWVFFLFFINLSSMAFSDPRIFEAGIICGNSTPPQGTNFVPAFVEDMEHLSVLMTRSHFGTNFTNVSMPIYALSQCHQDLSQTDCLLCFAAARTKLPRCLPSVSARIYLDGCFLRYENYSFYQESTDPIRDTVNCSSKSGSVDQNAEVDFAKAVGYAVEKATRIAVSNGGFGVTAEKGVYALGQCWGTVTGERCEECLVKAREELRKCAPSRDGRAMNAGCYMRYSTEKFYNDAGDTEANDGSSATGVIVTVALAAAACIMFSFFAAYAGFARLSKIKGERIDLHQVSIGLNKSNLHFKYETLEKATNYFSPSRKLGQGGAGSVYKGILPGRKVVAIKRLVFNTRQWVDDFFNEVNLISGIQHKNLVTLLGCSIEGPESLLVYEYVANKSLDHYIFDKNRTQVLNWKQRFDIILGTAEGLAYLHGDCKVRIIHRDIKSSNVLLDENLIPKVADFGLARCFGSDQTHLSTGIAGTLGYMAPEYLVRGQLTEKADVYSCGVLVLEIVCGRRNSSFIEDADTLSLLQMMWKLYKSNNMLEAVDKSLRGDFPPQEVLLVLRVGLLCTQASVSARPSMAQVVDMLNRKELEIPEATQPPFLNASSLMATNSNRFTSSNSFISSAARKIADSYTSSEYSTSVQSSDRKSRMEELL